MNNDSLVVPKFRSPSALRTRGNQQQICVSDGRRNERRPGVQATAESNTVSGCILNLPLQIGPRKLRPPGSFFIDRQSRIADRPFGRLMCATGDVISSALCLKKRESRMSAH